MSGIFSKGPERMVIRGNEHLTNVDVERAQEMAAAGWRWSGHTHPGISELSTLASDGDYAILSYFGQKTSVVYNSAGKYELFGEEV